MREGCRHFLLAVGLACTTVATGVNSAAVAVFRFPSAGRGWTTAALNAVAGLNTMVSGRPQPLIGRAGRESTGRCSGRRGRPGAAPAAGRPPPPEPTPRLPWFLRRRRRTPAGPGPGRRPSPSVHHLLLSQVAIDQGGSPVAGAGLIAMVATRLRSAARPPRSAERPAPLRALAGDAAPIVGSPQRSWSARPATPDRGRPTAWSGRRAGPGSPQESRRPPRAVAGAVHIRTGS